MKKILLLLVLLGAALIASLAGFFSYQLVSGGVADEQVSEQAPDLALKTHEGETIQLADLRGNLVLVNFWATWCAPCLKEIPLLITIQDRYRDQGVIFLGPAVDDPEQVRNMLPRLKINYPVLVGDRDITDAMEALGDTLGAMPFSVLIDAGGQIVHRKHGEFDQQELVELIERHLPATGAS